MAELLQLTTPRLALREVQVQDIDAICAYCAHPEVRRRLLPRQRHPAYLRYTISSALVDQQHQPRRRYYFVLHLHEGAPAIGCCALYVNFMERTGQIGWDLNYAYWGQGYMPEAAAKIVAFAFQKIDLTAIMADCAAANRASIRVMEKIGMSRQPLSLLMRWQLMFYYEQWRPVVRHTITRTAFEEQTVDG